MTAPTAFSRRRFTAGAALLPLLGAAGCLSGNPASEPQAPAGDKFAGEVEWWTINLQKNYAGYLNGMIDSYKGQHGDVKINWVDVPGQDITTKLLASIASGKVPDAVNFTSATTGLFGGQMRDLGEFFSAEELAVYAPGLTDTLQNADGGQIAIPWYNGGTSLAFYNTELLEPTDFDPEQPPKTFEDALALAVAYHKATGKSAMNLIPTSAVVQQNDLPLLSEDKKTAAFNTDQTREFIAKFKPLFDSGAIAPGSISSDVRNLPQNLENRLIAISPITVSSNLLNIQKNAPQVYEKIAVTAPVTGPSGKFMMPGQQIFGIPKAAKNPAAGAEWLKFVTSAANQVAFCKLVAIYPSAPAALEDPFFTDKTADAKTPADAAIATLIKTFPNSTDASLGSGNDEQLRLIFDNEIVAFLTGKKPADQALADAEKSWNTELAKPR